ncbi:MAG: Gfo/Idh/MocA family oxidoreductase [Pseudobdellovibrio sp.]
MALRGAVVGVGYLGQFHAQKINANTKAVLAGVCDFNFSQAQKVAGDLKTKAFEKPADLIGHVDYVHVAASTQAHYEIAKLFLQNKIPVLVEKPIAATIAQAEELCELSDKNNILLTVGHIERFNPAFQFLKDRITGVSYLELNRLAPFRTRGSDVSVLHDLTIHDIDLVQWLFNSEISDFEVSSRKLIKPTIDDVSIRLKLKNNVQVTINNSRVTPQIIRNYRSVGTREVIYMNTATLEAEILKPLSQEPFHEIEKIQLGKQDALALEADHFIECLLGHKTLAITGAEATLALRNVEKFILKAEG